MTLNNDDLDTIGTHESMIIEKIKTIDSDHAVIPSLGGTDKDDFLRYVTYHCDLEKTIVRHITLDINPLTHVMLSEFCNRPKVNDDVLYLFVDIINLQPPMPVEYDFLNKAKKYSKSINPIKYIVVINIAINSYSYRYFDKRAQEKFIVENINIEEPDYKNLIYIPSVILGEPVDHFHTHVLCIKHMCSNRGLDQIFIHRRLYRALFMKARICGISRVSTFNKSVNECFPDALVTESHESIADREMSMNDFIVQPYLINKADEYRVIICGNRMVIKFRKPRDIGTVNLPDNSKLTITQCNITKNDIITFDTINYEHYFLVDSLVYDHRYLVDKEVEIKYSFISTCVKLYRALNADTAISFDIVTYKNSKKFSIFEFSYEFGTMHMSDDTINFLLDGQIGLLDKKLKQL